LPAITIPKKLLPVSLALLQPKIPGSWCLSDSQSLPLLFSVQKPQRRHFSKSQRKFSAI